MAKEMTWTQCRFTRGDEETVGWINTWAAKRGNQVELLSKGFEGGLWTITSAGETREKNPSDQHRTFNNNI